MTETQETYECETCGYIGNKDTLQNHIVGTYMEHKMKPRTQETWEKEFDEKFKDWNFHHKGLVCFHDSVTENAVKIFIQETIEAVEKSAFKAGFERGRQENCHLHHQ